MASKAHKMVLKSKQGAEKYLYPISTGGSSFQFFACNIFVLFPTNLVTFPKL